ncbi:MAG: alkaline phosphatase family protein, partial [Bacteroidia bacterium]|nr:alkaline phosphatase family protein [Bacteroidia bacterium]
MKKILALILFAVVSVPATSQTSKKIDTKPKLLVGIVIDQMRMDYIYRYWDRLSEDGFKKLIDEGHLCSNAHHSQVPTYTAPGHACIFTGTTSSDHGIISNNWFDEKTGSIMYCVGDAESIGIGGIATLGNVSPKNIKTNMIADEIKLSTNFRGQCIGISLKERGAIFGAGHSGDGAYWFDNRTGNFMTSSYYKRLLPDWVREYNDLKNADRYKREKWNTLYDISSYTQSTIDDNSYEGIVSIETKPVFPHVLDNGKNYDLLKYSPFGNTMVLDISLKALKDLKLGMDDDLDLLAISFSASDYIGHRYGTNAIETEDVYLRLDKDIAKLLSVLEQTVGKDN